MSRTYYKYNMCNRLYVSNEWLQYVLIIIYDTYKLYTTILNLIVNALFKDYNTQIMVEIST